MPALIPAALLGWPIAAIALFAALPPRRALIASYLVAWLFLPAVELNPHGLPGIDRSSSASIGALAGALLFAPGALLALRPRWIDLPFALFCLSPLPSSVTNGLGWYDGLAHALEETLRWGVPWILGRAYLADLTGLRELAVAIFCGGLVYAPLCLWEVRMSPTLHADVYGVSTYGGVSYAADLGAWGSRPSVFLANPLELGMFLTSAALCGLALVWSGSLRALFGLPAGLLLAALIATAFASKNLGACTLLLAGACALALLRRRRSALVVYAILCAAPAYILLRSTQVWSGEQIVDLAARVHPARAESFAFRLTNENLLVDKALERPTFGWGGWGRNRIYDEDGKDISVSDGMWIIVLGTNGVVALAGIVAGLALPVAAALRRIAVGARDHPAVLPALGLAVVLAVYLVDNLVNNFLDPLLPLAGGALAGLPVVRVHPRPLARPAAYRAGAPCAGAPAPSNVSAGAPALALDGSGAEDES